MSLMAFENLSPYGAEYLEAFDDSNMALGIFEKNIFRKTHIRYRKIAIIAKSKKQKLLLSKNVAGQVDFTYMATIAHGTSNMDAAEDIAITNFDDLPLLLKSKGIACSSDHTGASFTEIFEAFYPDVYLERMVGDAFFLYDALEFANFCKYFPEDVSTLLRQHI